MTSICLYLQIHQPIRLKHYSCFQVGEDHFYEDTHENRTHIQAIVSSSYLPVNNALLDLIHQYKGAFKVSLSLSGTAFELFTKYAPEAIYSILQLAETGCVEFLSGTYNHSLSFVYSRDEFIRQVGKHTTMIKHMTGQTPQIFRNTGLVYNNDLGRLVAVMGYKGVVCESVAHFPGFVHNPPQLPSVKCLLGNKMPQDSKKILELSNDYDVINIFMDYETLAETRTDDQTGILAQMVNECQRRGSFEFITPSEAIAKHVSHGDYDVSEFSSSEGSKNDLDAWTGGELQRDALKRIYDLEWKVKKTRDADLVDEWARLQQQITSATWTTGDGVINIPLPLTVLTMLTSTT